MHLVNCRRNSDRSLQPTTRGGRPPVFSLFFGEFRLKSVLFGTDPFSLCNSVILDYRICHFATTNSGKTAS